MDICQVAWALLSTMSTLWLISHSGSMVQTVSSWGRAFMSTVATILFMAILLWVGSHPGQLLFYAAREKMTVQNPPETNGGLGRE